MTKKSFVFVALLTTNNILGQGHWGIGFTGATLNSDKSVASGVSLYIGRDISQTTNSSLSLSTNLKIGIQDKTGTGLATPIIIALVAIANQGGTNPDFSGVNANLFTEFPLLFHYNFGLGSNEETGKKFGFYFGGGFSYTITSYTDTSGNSQGISFFGYVVDGGIRFSKHADINIASLFSLRQPIGQIKIPVFYELTLSRYF